MQNAECKMQNFGSATLIILGVGFAHHKLSTMHSALCIQIIKSPTRLLSYRTIFHL